MRIFLRMTRQGIYAIAALIILVLILAIGLSSFDEKSAGTVAAEVKGACQNVTIGFGKEACYSLELQRVAYFSGPERAFEVLARLQQLDESAKGCHFIAHGIGYGTFDHNPADWRSHVNSIDQSCSYGAVHGIIEKHVDSLPEGKLSREYIPEICGPAPRTPNCNHIVGHLLLVEAQGNISGALELCSVFNDNKTQLKNCKSGVFMEHLIALNLNQHGYSSESFSASGGNYQKFCRTYHGDDAVACWREITHIALMQFNYDPKITFDFCNSAQTGEAARECKRHTIGQIATNKDYMIDTLKYMCKLQQPPDDPTFEKDCYGELVANLLYSIPKDKEKAVSFCSSLEPEFRDSCVSRIKKTLELVSASAD